MAVNLLVAALAGLSIACEKKERTSHQVRVSGTIGDANPDAGEGEGQGPGPVVRDSGVNIDDAATAQDVASAQDAQDIGEGEGAVADAGEGEGEGVAVGEGEGELPPIPQAPVLDHFVDLDFPCSFPPSLSPSAQENNILFTCSGPLRLFKLGIDADGMPGNLEQVGSDFGSEFTYASHHIVLPNGKTLITHTSPDGFTLLGNDGNVDQTIILDELPQINEPDFPYISFPNGAAFLDNKLCVATSNLDFPTYHAGTVLCFDYSVDPLTQVGQVDLESMTHLITEGKNPTGLATYGDFMLALASNSFAPAPEDQAVLNFFHPQSLQNGPIPLGAVTAQVSGQLAVNEERSLAFVGIQLPQNSLTTVDLNEGTVIKEELVPVTNFISYISLYNDGDNDVTILSDNGYLDFGGNVGNDTAGNLTFVKNTPPSEYSEPVTSELPINGNLGASAVLGSTLYVAVTSRDPNNNLVGSIWKADLSTLQFGEPVHAVPLDQ